MSHTPETAYSAAQKYHPLSPELLVDFHPSGSFADNPIHVGAYEAWYSLLESRAPDYGLHIERTSPDVEPDVARFVNLVVATNVIYDVNYRQHRAIGTRRVTDGLTEYYQRFPPSSEPASEERIAYQDEMIPVALRPDRRRRFLEIGVVLGLRSAFVKRRLRYPSRAATALLTVYGSTLFTLETK